MIPLIDDFLQLFIVTRLKWLKEHPAVIDHVFHTGKRETLKKLKEFIVHRKVSVVIGYPKSETSLPAYVITLAPENEQPISLGDETEQYIGRELSDYDDETIQSVERKMSEFIAGTYMNSTYRIECWSDNGDLTSYMYAILKWCLWGSRQDMLKLGWVNITLSGMDLEPVPDYMPMFIFRRSAQISLTYENLYYEDFDALTQYADILYHPDDYIEDDDGNIIDKDGNIVLEGKYTWILRPHYYEKPIYSNLEPKSYHTKSKD